ncbi:uncharacterized protein J8A68_002539 [[Candida] subhashii]|uniref:Uncharacterized protein n=1 Tax=[Candida] subhashii TaxID=561895 RepID=A0A8J5QIZ2_9ASCO|nr:uncharacterized protein J8A68_002539 [[Candida] subhashii]KAG7663912.1 hypothetical protein J8A68_002539 [[Candida] subhashii]
MFRSLISRQGSVIPVRGNVLQTSVRFAGHSKWANIKHDKAKNDAKKSKEALYVTRRIESCVKQYGKESNPQLDSLLERARKLNVTKAVITNAIKRGAGEMAADGPALSEVQYEFMGLGGIAMIVTASTDNKTRTISKVKNALSYLSASLSPCLYMFERKGEIVFYPKETKPAEDFDTVFETALEIGAEDFEEVETDKTPLYRIVCDTKDIPNIVTELKNKGYKLQDSSTRYFANVDSIVPFPDDHIKAFDKTLQELDDIQEVVDYYTNIEDEHIGRLQDSI